MQHDRLDFPLKGEQRDTVKRNLGLALRAAPWSSGQGYEALDRPFRRCEERPCGGSSNLPGAISTGIRRRRFPGEARKGGDRSARCPACCIRPAFEVAVEA